MASGLSSPHRFPLPSSSWQVLRPLPPGCPHNAPARWNRLMPCGTNNERLVRGSETRTRSQLSRRRFSRILNVLQTPPSRRRRPVSDILAVASKTTLGLLAATIYEILPNKANFPERTFNEIIEP